MGFYSPIMVPRAFLLDLDGTLYQGGAAVPGAPGILEELRRRDIPFRLVTNTTSRPRRILLGRLQGYGFRVAAVELFTAVSAGAGLAAERGYQRLLPLMAAEALEDLDGFELAGGTSGRPPGRTPDAVIVGDLGPGWSYDLMQEAFISLMDGAALIALSRDRYWRKGDDLALDLGPFVAGLEYAAGVEAVIAGKPSPAFYDTVVRDLDSSGVLPRSEIAMVGDDLWSDVEGARRAGLQGWLVRTGKFRADVLAASGLRPDRILDSVSGLALDGPGAAAGPD